MIQANLFGKPLPDGGTIGVAAPASPYESRSDVLRSVEWWESQGYGVKLAPHVLARDDFVAGDARDRAADLGALFADPEVDVVQCLQGGYGSAQVIPHLDFDAIAAGPKPFIGFSDITALHVAIRQRTGLATFYGNGLLGMGDPQTSAFSKKRLLAVLRGGGAGEVPPSPDDPFLRVIRGGTVTAPLVGGCLWLLMQTLGTPWEIDLDGAILFFEDTHLPPYYLDGILTQLAHAGKLDGVGWSRSRRHGEMRLGRPSGGVAADADARGRAGGSPGASRRPRAIQASLGAREAPRSHSARRHGDARCRREDAHVRAIRPGDGGGVRA